VPWAWTGPEKKVAREAGDRSLALRLDRLPDFKVFRTVIMPYLHHLLDMLLELQIRYLFIFSKKKNFKFVHLNLYSATDS
jgi:hypothetical protein